MNFSQFCVMLVLWAVMVLVTMLGDFILNDNACTGWIVSTLGFAVCLTLLLIQNGII